MKKQYKYTILALIATLLLTACSTSITSSKQDTSSSQTSTETMKKEETTMMDTTFSFTDFEGNQVKSSDYDGKKVYLKYWASWCPICLGGLEDLNTLAGENNDFVVLAVVTPDYKGEKSMADFKEWYNGLEFKNINVVFDQDGTYAKEFGIKGFPTSIYLGSDMQVSKVSPGHFTNDQIKEYMNTIK